MSLIFERVLDAFKLIRFPPYFKHSFLRAYGDNPIHHQGHQPQSWMSIIIIISSNNSNNVIDLWKSSWCLQTQQISDPSGTSKSSPTPAKTQEMSSIFEGVLDALTLPQGICRSSKMSSRTPAAVRNIKIITNSSKTQEMSPIFEGALDAFKLNRFQPNL